MAEIDRDPGIQDRLLNELRQKPRALTDAEDAMLLHRQIDLQNEYAKAARDLAQAYDDGRMDAAQLEQARVEGISNQLLDIYEIGKQAGTETGRGLAARKMMANEDFTLASLEMQKRADLGGRPLTEVERAELVKVAEEYRVKSEALEKRLATAEERLSESVSKESYDQLLKEAEAQPRIHKSVLDYAERFVSKMESTSEKYAKEIFGQFNSPTPDVLAKAAFIGATKIARGVVEIAKWTDEMAALLGDGFRKYANEIYKASQERLQSELKAEPKVRTVISKAKDAAEDHASILDSIKQRVELDEDISVLVQKLARGFVAQGINDRAKLIDAVHAALKEIVPEITRRDAMDAISGYGNFKLLSKDEISVQLRDLKGQMQQLSKLEDMQAGKAPSKTGVERRIPSDEERRLIKQVEEAKKKGGYKVTDPETQLRSALQSVKTRLRNQISDLEQQVKSKQKIVPEKRTVEYDAEAKALRERRDALKEEFEKVFGKSELTDAQRIKLAMGAVERSIAELERRIKEGDIAPAKRISKTKETPELKAARARRDALKEQLKELHDLSPAVTAAKEVSRLESQKKALEKDIAEKEKKLASGDLSPTGQRVNRPAANAEIEALKQKRDALSEQIEKARKGPSKTDEELANQAFKARAKAKIAELEERMAKGDFATRKKKPEPKLDAEATKLKFDLEKVKQRWLEARFNDRLKNQSTAQKIFRTAQEVLNFSRAVITSADFSAVLRQGGFITLGHPVRAARAMGPMLRALASEKAQFEVMEQIRANPNYNLAKQSGLYIAEDSPLSLNKLEEAYMSRWASKVPGVAASQRAYTTFLNKLRMDSFDGMVKSLSKTGTPTELEAQVIANYINVATGRGNIGKANQMAVGLNTVFFSPRLVASRFQLLAGQPIYRGSLRTRKLIAGEYARFLGGMALVYGLAQLADWDVEFDPRSSDFGKIRIGNTRIDPLTGLAQVTVLLSRLTSGETKSIRGHVTPVRGDVPFGKPDATDVMKSFLRTKLSPAFGTAVDILAGSNVVGEPTTPGSVAEKLLVPMSFDDILKAMQEQGIPKGTAIALLSLLGMGVQTFDENKPKPERPK